MQKGAGRPAKNSSSRNEEFSTKAEALERVKINRTQASQYELMAANPEIVEQAKQEARKNDDIVSRSAHTGEIYQPWLIFSRSYQNLRKIYKFRQRQEKMNII